MNKNICIIWSSAQQSTLPSCVVAHRALRVEKARTARRKKIVLKEINYFFNEENLSHYILVGGLCIHHGSWRPAAATALRIHIHYTFFQSVSLAHTEYHRFIIINTSFYLVLGKIGNVGCLCYYYLAHDRREGWLMAK
jgi:hypothetical protein